jgi:hypothetical protein
MVLIITSHILFLYYYDAMNGHNTSGINFDQFSISQLMRPVRQYPSNLEDDDREDFIRIRPEVRQDLIHDAESSAPIFSQTRLVGYLLNQVYKGTSSMLPEVIDSVSRHHVDELRKHVIAEGGRVALVTSPRFEHEQGTNLMMVIGQYLIQHDRRPVFSPNGTSAVVDKGPLTIQDLGCIFDANEYFDILVSEDEAYRKGWIDVYLHPDRNSNEA